MKRNGPAPVGVSPWMSPEPSGMTAPAPFSARRDRKGALTWLSLTITVRSSGVSMESTALNTSKFVAPVSGSAQRSNEYFTSAEVIVEPSWNVTSGRSRKV